MEKKKEIKDAPPMPDNVDEADGNFVAFFPEAKGFSTYRQESPPHYG